jgi:choline dehydrogenase-like flavoprotein
VSIQHFSVATAGGLPVYLEDSGASALALSPATATAEFRLNSSGAAEARQNLGSWVEEFAWLLAGAAGDYECRMTMNSGTNFDGSSLGSWLSLSSTRTWSHSRGSVGETTGTGTLEIRRASGSVLASCTITIIAVVE